MIIFCILAETHGFLASLKCFFQPLLMKHIFPYRQIVSSKNHQIFDWSLDQIFQGWTNLNLKIISEEIFIKFMAVMFVVVEGFMIQVKLFNGGKLW